MVRKADGVWRYRDAVGQLLLLHLRFDERDETGQPVLDKRGKLKKSFRPLIWRNGQWVSAWSDVRPLYGLPELAARPAAPVLVVEGEKTCDTARNLLPEYIIITWPQGSSGAPKADWSPLRGRQVWIWPDADIPGAKAGGGVAELVRKAGAASVALVRLPIGLPDGWDLADPLPAAWAVEDVRALIAAAETAPGDSASNLQCAPELQPGFRDNGGERPVIRIEAGKLSEIVDVAEQVLLAAGVGFYQRGGQIVRIVLCPVKVSNGFDVLMPRLVAVSATHLVEVLTQIIAWERFDGRVKDWILTDAPLKVALTYLAREKWILPVLTGLISAPTLRPDGTVLEHSGYDRSTGLLLDTEGVEFSALLSRPSEKQGRAALEVLKSLIATFPFVSGADRSVALSAILTAAIRTALPTAPLHAFSAPVAGSGKSLIVDLVCLIVTGRPCPVIAQGKTDEELEKRLGSALIAGDVVLSIDNCEIPLGGDLLCQCLTQAFVKVRLLGQSRLIDVPTGMAMFATGNNLVLLGDMTRRTLLCSLDPGVERPEAREFSVDPLALVRDDRKRFLRAALTVLRAYHVAGRPRQVAPLGSFSEWSDWVRSALLWFGESDPVATIEVARAADPRRDALATVLEQWFGVIGSRRATVREVIDFATAPSSTVGLPGSSAYSRPDFREALLVVAGDAGAVNSRRLGKWISANKLRVVNSLRLVSDAPDGHHKVAAWRVERVNLAGFAGNSGVSVSYTRELSKRDDNDNLYIGGAENPPNPGNPADDDAHIAGWQ
ncbi:MAG: DUF6371 domain-containing protein [Rhodospirillaceae bacterium]